MPSAVTFLAIDHGSDSGRCFAGHFSGERLTLEEVARWPNGPVRIGSSLYWDAFGLWQASSDALARAGQCWGERVRSVGVSTWGVDFALLAEDDTLLDAPHHYRDPRVEGMIDEACRVVSRETIYAQTGIQFIQVNTLFQLLALARRRAPCLLHAARLLMMPDLFHFWLSGVQATERSIASTTQCYNPHRGCWADEILGPLNLPRHIFGEIVEPGTTLGPLRSTIAETTGLTRTVVIAPVSHDTQSAVTATPAGARPWAFLSSGTWSLMGVERTEPLITPASLAADMTNEVGYGNTITLLTNIIGLWLLQESRRGWQRAGQSLTFAEIEQLAAHAPAFGSLVDPGDPSFLNPPDMLAAIRRYCERTGQAAPGQVGEIARCIYESLALTYRRVAQRLDILTGHRLETVHLVGGGAQSALLCQLAADAMERPVIAGPVEATALGSVLVQAMSLGYIASHAEARELVRRSFPPTVYQPRASTRWQEAEARFARMPPMASG
jgi:rhamnulokinase